MKVFIINYNRITSTRRLVDYLQTLPGAEVEILDNASTYPPLLRWYSNGCPVTVHQGKQDYGPRVLWANRGDLIPDDEVYAVTDSDLCLTGCPVDVLQHLTNGLDKYDDILKVGVSLALHDLPDAYPLKQFTIDRESGYWEQHRDDLFYDADVATTLAVYRPGPVAHYGPALRSKAPYQARHLPWYLTPATMTAEDRYYLDHANYKKWTGMVFSHHLQEHLETLGPAGYEEEGIDNG